MQGVQKRLFAEADNAKMKGDGDTGAEIVGGTEEFINIHVGIVHKPAWVVSTSPQEGVVDIVPSAEFPKTDKVAGISGIINSF